MEDIASACNSLFFILAESYFSRLSPSSLKPSQSPSTITHTVTPKVDWLWDSESGSASYQECHTVGKGGRAGNPMSPVLATKSLDLLLDQRLILVATVTTGRLLDLSESQLLHPKRKDQNNIYLIALRELTSKHTNHVILCLAPRTHSRSLNVERGLHSFLCSLAAHA